MITASLTIRRSQRYQLDVELSVPNGVTALYGPSGAGKTTILRFLAGLERGRTGDRIDIRNEDVTWHSATRYLPVHKRRVGYVFQQPQLLPHLTVIDNLNYASRRAAPGGIALAQICEWLSLQPLLNEPVTGLSGGEAQRVAIARTLANNPQLILMDEPLGSIDQQARSRILADLARVRRALDVPLVYVSHSLDEINFLADRVYVIENGKIITSGSVFDVSSSLDIGRGDENSYATVIAGQVAGYDGDFALASVDIGGASFYVHCDSLPPGTRVRIRVPATDVSISLTRPTGTSILNVIPARIKAIREEASSHSVLVLLASGDATLLARITKKSLAVLGLQPGQQVFAQIKGVALLTHNE
ncbi:MAG: molybdenum ABC transporter ATP-binding protein [Pseudomonadota bacterium]